MDWLPIESAPKDGRRVRLLIPYDTVKFNEAECTDEGYWDSLAVWKGFGEPVEVGCWRFDGEDGAFDIQPTHWQPLAA